METLTSDWQYIYYQKLIVVSVPLICFQIITAKLFFWPMGLADAISILNCFFLFFLFFFVFFCCSFLLLLVVVFIKKKWFLLFLTDFKLLLYQTVLWKFQKFWTSGTCWKHASKLSILSMFAYFAALSEGGGVGGIKMFDFCKTND